MTIQHHVTLGIKNDDRIIIGENCFIGAYAFILGNVKIGANSKIGAGTIVLHDVPDGSTVVNPVELKALASEANVQ
ncbi:TPA: DapH/DapD/GlmU-related protein [Streptococcus pneumoniae]|uniref:DapH/DapD/GlmU-related protein n=1 Tax=Streptococcus pneumoniae TaxID=1313 RepID=UPI002B1E45B1|nr:DapH/DapD/GlmU-related protein [Streptococcus pneumoniae]